MSTLRRKSDFPRSRSSNHESLLRRKAALDPKRKCSVARCDTPVGKNNIGSLCVAHRWRVREAGHAEAEIPKGKQRKAARIVAIRYLEDLALSRDAERFIMLMDRAVKLLSEPPSNALSPVQVRRESHSLTTYAKGQIIFAHLNKRKDWSSLARRLLLECLTLRIWAAAFYQHQKKDLNKLLFTTVGRTAVRFANVTKVQVRSVPKVIRTNCYSVSEGPTKVVWVDEQQTDKWTPSSYVRVGIGKRIFAAANDVLAPDFVTDAMVADAINIFETL